MPDKIRKSFVDTFWNPKKGYLADVVDGKTKDWTFRPNQIIALSMPYSPIDEKAGKLILESVEKELLTPRGLRSLSPSDKNYRGKFFGNLDQRNLSYHQGMVWPWLIGHFVEASLKLRGRDGLEQAYRLYNGFEDVMQESGLSTISEVYEGDPPHKASGAISQAWNVAELIRMEHNIRHFDEVTQPITL